MDPLESRDAVKEGIREILDDPSLRGARFIQAIHRVGSRHPIEPFQACLLALSGLRLPEPEARSFLIEIDRHRDQLEADLGRDPGLGVAVADHLHSRAVPLVDPGFRSPEQDRETAATAARPEAAFIDLLEREVQRSERFDRPLGIALFEPDAAGAPALAIDQALVVAREVCRDTDLASELAPNLFGLILPCTDSPGSMRASERVLNRLITRTGVQWSAGVVASPEQPRDAEGLLRRAEWAREVARASGGGGVRAYRPERRAHPRRPVAGSFTGELRLGAQPDVPSGDVPGEGRIEVTDVSLGGARFGARQELVPGTDVVLTLRESSARPREVALPGWIVRVRQTPDAAEGAAWEAALRFSARESQILRLAGMLANLPAGEAGAESGA